MPPFLHPRLAPVVVNANQSASSQISGFYGPGTWAAWILAIVSSVIALRKHHDDHAALNLIPPILYINWTAIDLLERLHTEEISHELVASAAGITLWGIWYLTWVQVILRTHDDDRCLKCQRRTIRAMCVIAFILPFIAFIATILHVHFAASNSNRAERYLFKNMDKFNMIMFFVSMVACFRYHVLVAWRVAFPQRKHSPAKIDRFERVCLGVGVVGIIMLSLSCLVQTFQYSAELRDVKDYRWSCALKPCAPQSITESDQGFALCCGLFMFVYEIGPDVVNVCKKWIDAATTMSD
jgi:uncharacterized membrane protein